MLADSDVGSIITAGQSGVRWGYRLLPLQFLLIPVLYVVQELTVRLGIFTGRGHGTLIRETFGPVWAWVSAAGLAVATAGAVLTEFSGVAGVGELVGLPRLISMPIAAAGLLAIVMAGSYRRVERAAIIIGLLELSFLAVAWAARPDVSALLHQSVDLPVGNPDFLYLVSANIGALIMPWMIFYQQAAVARKGLGPEHHVAARWDTAVGAVVTQLVMAAVLVASASAMPPGSGLASVGDMSRALTPLLGLSIGRLVFGLGVLGAGLVAAIVSSLALAWGLEEVAGGDRTLSPSKWFRPVYATCVIGGAAAVVVAPDLVSLNVGVQVLNAMLLPLVLAFLVRLAMVALPQAQRLRGRSLAAVGAMCAATGALGAVTGLIGLFR